MSLVIVIIIIVVIIAIIHPFVKNKTVSRKIQAPFPSKNDNNGESLPYYMFVDVETTGLLPKYINLSRDLNYLPNIVQIAWILFDYEGNYIKSEDFIIKQDKEVPKKAVKIHGITRKKSQKQGVDANYAYLKFISDYPNVKIISAHNANSDIRFIQAMLVRFGLNYNLQGKPIHCTMLNTTKLCKLKKNNDYPGYKWPKLEELIGKVYNNNANSNVKLVGAHNAFNDVWATAKCYFELLKNGFDFKDNSKEIWNDVDFPNDLKEMLPNDNTYIFQKKSFKLKKENISNTILISAIILFMIYFISFLYNSGASIKNTVPKKYYTTANLNIRKGPGTEYPIIKVLNKEVVVFSNDSIINGFICILNKDKTCLGWASKDYLR